MSRKSISKVATLFWFILFLGIALRVYRLTQVPASLNPDEAALGYTAYSLLKTGADEHGESFPLIFKSFGDWKMGLYSYLTILPVALFDLTETTTKFVSVISGISGILLIYLLGVELFGQRKIGLLSSLFYSLSPWGIFFSRMALEVNLATTLFTGALLLFLKYSKSHNIKLLFFSATIFILTMLAYHAYLLFTPLFLFLTLFFYRGRFIISKGLVFSVLLVLFFALLLGYIVYQASGNKLGDLSIANNRDIIYGRIESFRNDPTNEGDFFKKLLHNKYLGLSYHLVQNYLATFSPTFLFDKGGQKILHNTGYSGNLYFLDALLILLGLGFLFHNHDRSLKLVLIWLAIAPLSSSFTLDHPSSTRLFVLMPAFVLISAYGLYHFFRLFPPSIFRVSALVSLGLLLFLNVIIFLDGYFHHLNIRRASFMGYGFREIVGLAKDYPNHKIVFSRAENFPYIYFLFYGKINPREFRDEVVYYPPTAEGFYLVKSFGRFDFPANMDHVTSGGNFKENTIYVEKYGIHSDSGSVDLPSGEPRFWYYISEHDGY